MILGFDPGRDKCGIAIVDPDGAVPYHQVVLAAEAVATLQGLCRNFAITQIVLGNQTTSGTWQRTLQENLPPTIPITPVDERYSTLEARDRYWQMYPPQGLTRLIPQGMRSPPRAIDDIVAIILVERYLRLAKPESTKPAGLI
ncbi:MAG: pre-16S rRNA-processing nuclease YqgF [Oscillatoriales cyanobacterium SM2_3_0]|nr:pre-16S rRNA-processing nuclease YqgF [Oscillatoriales cyanobacterium SM2_3_0]